MLWTRLRGVALAMGLGVALVLSACNGPTLPLPPPATPMLIVDAASGTVTLRGGPGNVAPRALVIVYNEDLERGVVVMATEQGEWEATVEAVVGHSLTVWQELGVDRGASLFLEVR
ncbi:MAG: hypothetical protein IT379_40240 [Deltaproteobacteria bacterium]|nr:hypothetical protein [Deltaproteobacteria bacterium]